MLIITVVMTVFSPVDVFDVLKTPKNMCFRKTVIMTVWMKVLNWKFRTTTWHYLAIIGQIFRAVSLFLTDWEHVSCVTLFGPPGTCLNTYIFMRLGRNTHAIRAICDTRYAIRNTRHTIRETRDTSDTRYAIRWYHLGCAFVGSDLLNVPAAWLVYPSRIKVFESV